MHLATPLQRAKNLAQSHGWRWEELTTLDHRYYELLVQKGFRPSTTTQGSRARRSSALRRRKTKQRANAARR